MSESKRRYLGANVDDGSAVIEEGGRLFRSFDAGSASPFLRLLADEAIYRDLVEHRLIPTWVPSDKQEPGRKLLEHRFITPQSFWPEWSFDMLRDSALATIDLTRRLLKSNLILKDAHPYNTLFEGCQPWFVDVSSIVARTPMMERGWRTSFAVEYFLPLLATRNWRRWLRRWLISTENHPRTKTRIGLVIDRLYPPWKRFQRGRDFPAQVEAIATWCRSLKPGSYATPWEDYYSREVVPVVEKPETYTPKENSTVEALRYCHQAGCRTLVDIASNAGWFSRLAASMGFSVTAFDYDSRAINSLYLSLKRVEPAPDILPLVMDFIHPTPPHGIQNCWPAASARLAADVTLAMAIVHHLTLGQKWTFDRFAARLAEFTRRFAIVEFIDPADIHLARRARRLSWYTRAQFLADMGRHFELVAEFPSRPETRSVMLFRRRD